MNVYINSIAGVKDAMESLLMSKRSWTKERADELKLLCDSVLTSDGFIGHGVPDDIKKEFDVEFNKLIKYGLKFGHTTLLRFIDISITVEGLHRAGQDGIDSHAKRMDNRIVRSSTRLATFEDGEKSDWYKGKAMSTDEMIKILDEKDCGIGTLPATVQLGSDTWVKSPFGYVKSEYIDNKDVLRGNYPLSIPSNFIFKIQYPELQHIYSVRGRHSTANPEVREVAEKIKKGLLEVFPPLGYYLDKVYDPVSDEFVRVSNAVYIDERRYKTLLNSLD